MHLLVPGAYRLGSLVVRVLILLSQCTFWCRVLTDGIAEICLTIASDWSQCTFWCRVLTDDEWQTGWLPSSRSQCTFWCRVLTDQLARLEQQQNNQSQCTFWCRVLTDPGGNASGAAGTAVSMHLLVPGAYRHGIDVPKPIDLHDVSMHLLVPGAYRPARLVFC